MRLFRPTFSLGLALTFFVPSPASAYQIDCAILLCLAGGFPPSVPCARARAEMIRRITPWPIEPPLQIWRCPMHAAFDLPAAERPAVRLYQIAANPAQTPRSPAANRGTVCRSTGASCDRRIHRWKRNRRCRYQRPRIRLRALHPGVQRGSRSTALDRWRQRHLQSKPARPRRNIRHPGGFQLARLLRRGAARGLRRPGRLGGLQHAGRQPLPGDIQAIRLHRVARSRGRLRVRAS